MDDISKVYTPVTIADAPMPSQNMSTSQQTTTPSTGSVSSPNTMPNTSPPTQRIAVNVIGSVLDTQTRRIIRQFTFTPTGAMQIGDYTQGEQGDIRISSEGIVARNSGGNETFSLDGDTGDATFAGRLQTGSLIAGQVAVGDDSIQIDGDNKRIIFYDNTGTPVILIGQA